MFENFPLFPDSASTFSGKVDGLFLFLCCMSAFFSVLISGTIIYFAIKYKRRSRDEVPKTIHGSTALELTWSLIPLAIAMGIFVWSATIYFEMTRPPSGALDVYVVGKQWMWKVQHISGRREINELHVPVGRPVRLTMASEDVIHSFFIPAFRVKYDVVPGRHRTMWFEATKPGTYHLFCAEYCGTKHAGMKGKVIVMEADEFQTWLSGGPSTGNLASAGEKLFQDLACHTCHKTDTTGRGPVLNGLYGKQVQLQTGETVVADEDYLRESIVTPQAKMVTGYMPIMPTYQGLITEEGLLQILAYIKSLGPSGAPAVPSGQPVLVPQTQGVSLNQP